MMRLALILILASTCSSVLAAQEWAAELEGQQVIAEGTDPMPATLALPGWDRPFFSAVEEVFLPSGEIATAQASQAFEEEKELPGFQGHAIANAPRAGGEQCYEMTIAYDSGEEHNLLGRDLPSALSAADKVLLARVTGVRVGVFQTSVNALVRVETVEALKGGSPLAETNYITQKSVEFEIWGRSVCKVDLRAPEPLKIGESVLIIAVDRPGSNYLGYTPHIIPIRNSPVRLARQLRNEAMDSLSGEEFLQLVRSKLALETSQ